MSEFSEVPFSEDDFSGVARLFPVPGLVLFPHVMQTLHVFEERYRAMMDEAVADDQLIAIALLEPGWETDYAGRPPLAPTACLGRVLTHHRFPDGRYNLMLLGVRRIRLTGEVDPPQAYRQAHAEVVAEHTPDNAAQLHARLLKSLRSGVPGTALTSESMQEVLSRDLPLGVLTDLLGYALPLEVDIKQALLSDPDAGSRAQRLIQTLDSGALGGGNPWTPPAFSEN